jgi:hypothetical protein
VLTVLTNHAYDAYHATSVTHTAILPVSQAARAGSRDYNTNVEGTAGKDVGSLVPLCRCIWVLTATSQPGRDRVSYSGEPHISLEGARVVCMYVCMYIVILR